MMVQLFEKVEILEGYREGEIGTVIKLNEKTCTVQFSNYEVHSYDVTDVCEA